MNDSSVDVSYLVNRQKIIFIGDVSVGKTSIINVLMGQKFNNFGIFNYLIKCLRYDILIITN